MFLLLISVTILLTDIALARRGVQAPYSGPCRCVPDQWEGVLRSVEREYDYQERRSLESESSVRVFYDYANRRFASEDLESGRWALDDYVTGLRYSITRNSCRGIRTTERMRRMCFPVNLEKIGSMLLGKRLPVNIWQFYEPHNVTIRTTTTIDSCIPVSEEVSVTETDYATLTSTFYSDVTLGIHNKHVFHPPQDCVIISSSDLEVETPAKRKKRHAYITAPLGRVLP